MTSPLERLSQLSLQQLLDLNAPLGFALLLVPGHHFAHQGARHQQQGKAQWRIQVQQLQEVELAQAF
jgi:hypothetical protein